MRRFLVVLALVALGLPAGAGSRSDPESPHYPQALRQLKAALTLERHALTAPRSRALEDLAKSRSLLDHAIDNSGNLHTVGIAYQADEIAIRRLKKNDRGWVDMVRIAIKNKKESISTVEDRVPSTERTDCSAAKEFDLYAVPAGYTGSVADVYPHGVPRTATNLQIRFLDAGGRPAPDHPFPGQSWTAKIAGFTTRGGETVLHVHIDVSGTGIGKPDEKHVHWKVVVTWDC